MTIGDVCMRSVATAYPDETVVDAARKMRDQHVGDVVVTDTQARPVGILTDRDIVVAAVAQSADKLAGLLVGDVMSSDLVTARASDPISDALKIMRARGIRRLPIVSGDGRLVGLVAFDDILGVMSDELVQLVGLVARQQTQEHVLRP